MTRGVVALDVDATVADALQLARERRVGALPVLDARDHVIAVLDDRHLLRAALDGTARTVRELVDAGVGATVVHVTQDDDVATIAAAILENDVPAAVIVDDDEVIGIVSRSDALRALLRERARRFDAADGASGWRVRVEDRAVTIVGPAAASF